MPDTKSYTNSQTIVLVAAVLLLLALGYSIQPVLSPFVLAGALIYLLYPLRREALAGRLMWLGVFLFVFWFIYSLLGLLAPFIIAFLIAYILNPLVSRLEQRKSPRWASSLLLVLLFIACIVLVVLFVLPLAAQQFNSIIAGLSSIANDLSVMIKSGQVFDVLERYGVPVEKARDIVTEQITPRLQGVLEGLFGSVLNVVTGFSTIMFSLINIIIIPFLVFYLLMDFPSITDRFATLFPSHRREHAVEIGRKIDAVLGSYLRGAIIVAMIQGLISVVGLWFIGVQYSLVLGIMTGVFNFIPYVGLVASLAVASIVALFSGEPVMVKVFGVITLYLSQKLFEATVLGPKIIGKQVGLHPVLLMLCLLVFGYFMGLIGMLIAVPTTALILLLFREWEERREAAVQAPPQEL